MQKFSKPSAPMEKSHSESAHEVVTDLLPEEYEVIGHGENTGSIVELSPVEMQQQYFDYLSEDWVRYEKSNHNYLSQIIAFALFGAPTIEGDLNFTEENFKLEGYSTRQMETVSKVYEKICEQSKYSHNGEDIFMSVLLVVCARPKSSGYFSSSGSWLDLHTKTDSETWRTAVFRVRKCIALTEGADPCRIYIDENARVYQSWQSYLTDNTNPKCVLIVPQNGEYQGEPESDFEAVKLTVIASPALGVKSRVLSTVDTVNTAASLAAVGVLGAAVFTPVAPVVLAGATVATIATGFYGLVRSSLHLRDRSVHEQTISPTDPQARGSWINIAASSVGLAAGAASSLLSKTAAAGSNLTKHGQAIAMSVDILRHANMLTGGAGIVHGLFDMIQKYHKHGEKPSKLELFQFTAATLFFCHAAVTSRTAQNIIEEAQAQTLNEYSATLRSNRHRKIFAKMSAESRRVNGVVQGNTEVIKGIKTIANKDQYFADVLKINKDLNQQKLRISMTADGHVNLNAQHKFHPSELYNMGKDSRTELFTSLGQDTLTTPNASTKLTTTTTGAVQTFSNNDAESKSNVLVGINPGEIIRIGSFLVRISMSSSESIARTLENLSPQAHTNLMQVALNVLQKLVPEEVQKLRIFNPEEDLLVQVVKFVFKYMQHQRPLGETCSDDHCITTVVKEFFQDGLVRQDTILMVKDRMMQWVEEQLACLQKAQPEKVHVVCTVCQGVRYCK